jgi:hypothetical protein
MDVTSRSCSRVEDKLAQRMRREIGEMDALGPAHPLLAWIEAHLDQIGG